ATLGITDRKTGAATAPSIVAQAARSGNDFGARLATTPTTSYMSTLGDLAIGTPADYANGVFTMRVTASTSDLAHSFTAGVDDVFATVTYSQSSGVAGECNPSNNWTVAHTSNVPLCTNATVN